MRTFLVLGLALVSMAAVPSEAEAATINLGNLSPLECSWYSNNPYLKLQSDECEIVVSTNSCEVQDTPTYDNLCLCSGHLIYGEQNGDCNGFSLSGDIWSEI